MKITHQRISDFQLSFSHLRQSYKIVFLYRDIEKYVVKVYNNSMIIMIVIDLLF